MKKTKIKLRDDLESKQGGITYEWAEVPNCIFISYTSRGFQVASEHWEETQWIPRSAIHKSSETKDAHTNHFGTMIVLRKILERMGKLKPKPPKQKPGKDNEST